MASLCLSASVSLSLRPQSSSYSSSPPSTSACPSCSSPAANQLGFRRSPSSLSLLLLRTLRFPGSGSRRLGQVVRMAPDEERITRRSPLDFPIEWERPKPGRRPDIFPQFSPMKTPLPPPMPADPPEEDEEEEEEKKEEEEEEPEKEEEKPESPEGS